MVKKVMTNLDLLKAFGPDCIPVVVLKNCVQKSLVFQIVRGFLQSSLYLRVLGVRPTTKNSRPVSLLSVVCKVFEKHVTRLFDHLEKCGLFSDFQYGFKSFRPTADLLTVVSDWIARAFSRSGATRAVAIDISNHFDRVWHADILHKLESYGISAQIFCFISAFLGNRRLQVILDEKYSQKYSVNVGVP